MNDRPASPARPPERPLMRNPAEELAAAVFALAFVMLCAVTFRDGSAADFRALWLAGQFLAEGHPELVYPRDATVFTMLPPPEWVDRLAGQGFSGEIYPFIYPPIWAWLAARATGVMSLDALLDWVVVINPLLITVMLLAARALVAPGMRIWAYLGLGFVVLWLTQAGLVALHQSQPQILVACLTVVAAERAEHRWPVLAGVLLALAAAIKLYPALYALFWLASGQRRAVASFALAGAMLAALSVWLTGWALHGDFLHMVRVIANTALVTRQSYALENLVAQLCCFDRMQLVPAPPTDPNGAGVFGWYVLAKPALFSAVFKAVQVAAVVWIIVLFRRAPADRAGRGMLWPFAYALLTLLGPIAWSYHFLASVAFLPGFVVRFGRGRAAVLLGSLILMGAAPVTSQLAGFFGPTRLVQVAGTLVMAAMTAVFWLAAHPARRARDW